MDQETLTDARDFLIWCGFTIGGILVSPALAIAVSIISMMIFGINAGRDGRGSNPDSGFQGMAIIAGIVGYVLPCFLIGLILVLLAAAIYASSRSSKEENKNPSSKHMHNRWRLFGVYCASVGAVLLASWLHLPVMGKFLRDWSKILVAPTILGVLLLLVGFAIIRSNSSV